MIANSAPPGIGVRTQNPAVAKRNLLLFSMYPMVPRPIHYRVCASLFPPLEMSILSVKSLVCVLWSRPGTPLIGPHGKRYASGTEYEVASARESWKATGGPETMIYLQDATAQIRQFPDSEFQKMVDQLKALKRFVAEYLPRKSPSFARPCSRVVWFW